MKAVRITFQTIEENGTVDLERKFDVPVKLLSESRVPLLPLEAKREAERFWAAVVAMGRFEDDQKR